MDSIEIVKAYFAALDSTDMEQVDPYLSEHYSWLILPRSRWTRMQCLA